MDCNIPAFKQSCTTATGVIKADKKAEKTEAEDN